MVKVWLVAALFLAIAVPIMPSLARAASMPICGEGRRVNCVVDGDTFWLNSEKIRIENIDAPELHAQCDRELALAEAARDRLQALLSGQRVGLQRDGRDQYGRTLAVVTAGGQDVGAVLVSEGFARRWDGARHPWC